MTLGGSNTAVLRMLAQSSEQWQSPMTMLSYLSCIVKRARPSGLTIMVTSHSVTEVASGGVTVMTLHNHKNCRRLISTVRPRQRL